MSYKLAVDPNLHFTPDKFIDKLRNSGRKDPPSQNPDFFPVHPTPHTLLQLASRLFDPDPHPDTKPSQDLPEGWSLLTSASNSSNAYLGVAYWNPDSEQLVIAHRLHGESVKMDVELVKDCHGNWGGVLRHKFSSQINSAITFTHRLVEDVRGEFQNVQVFLTGHSLGGWLAQVCTFTLEFLHRENDYFVKKSGNDDGDGTSSQHQGAHPHTLTFENPGCKKTLENLKEEFDTDSSSLDLPFPINLNHLDITSLLSCPNPLNTCNSHVGDVYRILVDVPKSKFRSSLRRKTPPKLGSCMIGGVDWNPSFDVTTGGVGLDSKGNSRILKVIHWPSSDGLFGRRDYKEFFKVATQKLSYHVEPRNFIYPGPVSQSVLIDLRMFFLGLLPGPDSSRRAKPELEGVIRLRYATCEIDKKVLSLSVFSQREQKFLRDFEKILKIKDNIFPYQKFENSLEILSHFRIQDSTSTFVYKSRDLDPDAVSQFIGFVHHLDSHSDLALKTIDLFEIGNEHYLKILGEKILIDFDIDKGKLEFPPWNPSDSIVQFYNFQIEDRNGIGFKYIWRVIQSSPLFQSVYANFFTILKLSWLVKIDRFKSIENILSRTAPNIKSLIILDCEEEFDVPKTETFLTRVLDYATKERGNLKLVFVTYDDLLPLFLASTLDPSNLSTKKIQPLVFSDLDDRSKKHLLSLSQVNFQGQVIPLSNIFGANQLDCLANAPLGQLGSTPTNGPIVIGKLVATPRHFGDSTCHIGRRIKVLPKKSELVGKIESRFVDDFIRPTSNDIELTSGRLKYRKTVIVSGVRGMGKSTLLTGIAQKIKGSSGSVWIFRLDLRTDLSQFMEKLLERAEEDLQGVAGTIEFLCQDVLNLFSDVEVKLLRNCLSNGSSPCKIVFLIDDFDEISLHPTAAIGGKMMKLIQSLQKSEVHQIWMTTKPSLNLIEKLREGLQESVFGLEGFSRENQVEFLTSFWNKARPANAEAKAATVTDKLGLALLEGSLIRRRILEAFAEELIKDGGIMRTMMGGLTLEIPRLCEILAEHYKDAALQFETDQLAAPRLVVPSYSRSRGGYGSGLGSRLFDTVVSSSFSMWDD